jgi:16S rRNA (cytidine1402-2'-O)-methyltransferase
MPKGRLFLFPMTLGSDELNHVIPIEVQEKLKDFRFFAVENVKTTRRYLRRIDRTFPIDESHFFELNKRTKATDLPTIIKPILEGNNMAIISEAGCPGVADPGADLVAFAHQHKIHVHPYVGPSSILLALMGSGFNGQSFAFHGYLPKERKQRVKAFKDFEQTVRSTGQTQLFMETPFRNNNLLEDLLNELLDETLLSIAVNLTLHNERIQTMSVREWRDNAFDLNKQPCIFSIGRTGG